ncbi:uncharacterized protein LOC121834182 [Ixodes scapularis]|uniref:uncharacterized protein LOC121834182 n=1 Tax=Ixodes scapularis TaxID=6945 RepID=UPI001C38EA15|nr:uncharacterized protein LOC121834182 [Ixodes scapularis]
MLCDILVRALPYEVTVEYHRQVNNTAFTNAAAQDQGDGSAAGTSSSGARSEKKFSDGIYLQTFKAFLVTNAGSCYVKGIIDGGSQRTFIKEEVAQRLGLKVPRRTKIALNTFASNASKVIERSPVVEVKLKSQFDNTEITFEAISIPVICQDVSTPTTDIPFVRFLRESSKNLADDVIFPGVKTVPEKSLLIGSDQLWKFCTGDVIRCADVDGLVAINTKMGWTLQGPSRQVGRLQWDSSLMICVLQAKTKETQVEEALQPFWELDRMGVADSELGDTDADTITHFEQNIIKKNGLYEVALPWKEDTFDMLASNWEVAILRLGSLLRRISRKKGLLKRNVMRQAGMTLRKWTANNEQLQEQFNKEEPTFMTEEKSLSPSPTSKVLGMMWDHEGDCFIYKVEALLEFLSANVDTKRFILKAASRVFDPLGLIAPFVLTAKLLFQKLWTLGISWDEELPADLITEWHARTADLVQLHSLSIPRHVKRGIQAGANKVQLHVFVDASTKAYGSCAYFRTADDQGETATMLVVAKTRVAPIKPLSLPRLKLMGPNIGARLLRYIKQSYYDVELDYIMWTDSTVALSWVRGVPEKWKPFVKNRVAEIRVMTSPDHWRHCPGQENRADLLTRGLGVQELRANSLWWKGPSWLSQEPSECPESSVFLEDTPQLEVKEETHVLLEKGQEVPSLFDTGSYENYQKVLRITAWVIRFANNAQKRNDKIRGGLIAAELDKAEQYWIRQIQNERFQTDIMLREKNTTEVNVRLAEYHPLFGENKILRVGGRLQRLTESLDVKHPVLLPNDHDFVKLIVMHAHCKVMHGELFYNICDLYVESRMSNKRKDFSISNADAVLLTMMKLYHNLKFSLFGVLSGVQDDSF